MPKMKNTAQLQIEFWKDNSGTRKRVLTFHIVDTPPAKIWVDSLEEEMNNPNYTGPEIRIACTGNNNVDTASEELFNAIEHVNTNYNHLGFSLPEWKHPMTGTIEEQIFKLNRIHESFHKEEDRQSAVSNKFRDTLANSAERVIFARLLNVVNIKIHQLEDLLKHSNGGPRKHSYAVTYLGGIHTNQRKTFKIPDNWRKYFTDEPNVQECYLTASYCTIGKDLYSCQADNDIELVKKGMVAPKLDITSEFNINKTNRTVSKNKTFNYRHQLERTYDVLKWVIDNDLMDYIDITDKKHFYPSQCVLGFADENISTKEFDTLLSEWKLHRLILDRTKTDA